MTKRKLWTSQDRYTDWGKRFELTHPDGTIETYVVECVKVAYPRKQQIMKTEFGVRVIDRYRPLLDGKTGRPVKPRTKYFTFAQSFHDGPNSKRDSLGGFSSGEFITIVNNRKATTLIFDLESRGFEVAQEY